MSKNVANPSMFPLPNTVQYLPVLIYSPENFLISNLIKPADLFHSSPYPHFKVSNLLSVWVKAHVSAAYSATLQTKHFIILFFSSRFILPVKQFLFLNKYLLHHLNSLPNFLCAISIYPSSDILSYLIIWIASIVPLDIFFNLLFPFQPRHICLIVRYYTSPSFFWHQIFISYSLLTLFRLSISCCNPF